MPPGGPPGPGSTSSFRSRPPRSLPDQGRAQGPFSGAHLGGQALPTHLPPVPTQGILMSALPYGWSKIYCHCQGVFCSLEAQTFDTQKLGKCHFLCFCPLLRQWSQTGLGDWEREAVRGSRKHWCVCLCVKKRERERERERSFNHVKSTCHRSVLWPDSCSVCMAVIGGCTHIPRAPPRTWRNCEKEDSQA